MPGDRNTSIKRGQLKPIRSDDLDAINVPSSGQVPSLGDDGQFIWVEPSGTIAGEMPSNYCEVPYFETSSTEFVDIIGCSLEITITNAVRIYTIFSYVLGTNKQNSEAEIRLYIDGETPHYSPALKTDIVEVTDEENGSINFRTDILAPGTYTIKAQIRKSSGDELVFIVNGMIFNFALQSSIGTADIIPTEDSGISVQDALNALEIDQHAPESDNQTADTVPTDETGISVQDWLDSLEGVKHTQNTDTGTNQNDFLIGDGADTDKSITANNADATKPKIKYNAGTNKWQYSNNGIDFTDIGSGGAGGALADLDDVLFDTGTPTDGQVLTYDEISGKWKAETPISPEFEFGLFTLDENEDLMPIAGDALDTFYELDINGDIEPKE